MSEARVLHTRCQLTDKHKTKDRSLLTLPYPTCWSSPWAASTSRFTQRSLRAEPDAASSCRKKKSFQRQERPATTTTLRATPDHHNAEDIQPSFNFRRRAKPDLFVVKIPSAPELCWWFGLLSGALGSGADTLGVRRMQSRALVLSPLIGASPSTTDAEEVAPDIIRPPGSSSSRH